MKAVCWQGARSVSVEEVPDPVLLRPRDAIVRITTTAICGSDLHLYNGFIPGMKAGDIIGHEFMGEVVDVGPAVRTVQRGDRVIVPAIIACGGCYYCQRSLFSLCDNTNPNAWELETICGFSPAAVFGHPHPFGGYAGGQAEYARVPMADVGLFPIPREIPDEKVLFLTDIFPTGFMAAENCDIQPGDTVAVWGCGPVGQFAIQSCFLLGASRVIAIDGVPDRLSLASRASGAEVINYEQLNGGGVYEALRDMTGGRGPDAVLDAVGMEAHGLGLMGLYDRAKQAMMLESDRPAVLREVIRACRKGGTVSLIGVYSGFDDKIPMGAAFNKALTFRMGPVHVHRYLPRLFDLVLSGRIDPSFVVTHRMPLDQAPEAYRLFAEKRDGCIKVVLDPLARPQPPMRGSARERITISHGKGSTMQQDRTHGARGGRDAAEQTVIAWLKDAYAMEQAQIATLQDHAEEAEDFPELQSRLEQHLEQTRRHADLVRQCLERHDQSPSTVRTAMGRLGTLFHEMGSKMASDEVIKNSLMDCSAEHFEIAAYLSLAAGARGIGDIETAQVCEQILNEEREMAVWLEQAIPLVTDEFLSRQAVS